MKGQNRRVRRRDAGFSFVELLVTIIIAGIAFAAFVPLFAGATQKNASDLFRQSALNVAQDRIEKVRALDFASITQANLNSTTFVNGTFGPTATIGTGGSLRKFTVNYTVDTTNPTYTAVIVDVWWTPPPSPVKHVIVQTVIYRQYAGPTLASFYVTPSVNDAGVIGNTVINNLSLIKLSALPTTQWLGGNTASVQFTVYSAGGTALASQTVTYASDGSAGYGSNYGVTSNTFWWNWDSTGVSDGTYSVSAAGYSGSFFGPTERFYFKIQRGNALAAPQNLTATPGQHSVTLGWSAVPNATKYNIYRYDSNAAAWVLIGTVVGQSTTTYTDSGPLTANTSYQYKVVGVDATNNEGLDATVTTTTTSFGVMLPLAPQNLTATGDYPSAGVIELTWNPPTSWGSAAQDYLIEMSANGTSGWSTVGSAVPYNGSSNGDAGPFVSDYTAGSGVTLFFRVTARAAGGAFDATSVSGVVSASTAAVTYKGPLTLTNTTNGANKDVYVWVQMVGSGMYYDTSGVSYLAANKPAGVLVPDQNGTALFTLPNGTYNIWVSSSASYSGVGSSAQTSAIINNAPAAANVHR